MTKLLWAVVVGTIVAIAYLCWRRYRTWQDKQRAEEDRFAAFMAGTVNTAKPEEPVADPVPAPEPARTLAQEKLLFEAASKAAEAGEPEISRRLYARLLERYPHTAFAGDARAGMEAQKRKVARLP